MLIATQKVIYFDLAWVSFEFIKKRGQHILINHFLHEYMSLYLVNNFYL